MGVSLAIKSYKRQAERALALKSGRLSADLPQEMMCGDLDYLEAIFPFFSWCNQLALLLDKISNECGDQNLDQWRRERSEYYAQLIVQRFNYKFQDKTVPRIPPRWLKEWYFRAKGVSPIELES